MLVGPTHSHSTISFDGKVELDALQQFYSERGNDFCLMSEHIEGLNTDAIEQMLARYRALPERRCLMIPGIEIDDLHILIYGVERAHPFQSYEDLAAKYYEDGAFIVVSHPAKIHGPLPDVIHPWIRGVEVWNSRHDGRHNPRDKSVELWRELHRADPRVVPLGAMDFHSTSDYSNVQVGVETPRVASDIIHAIRENRHVILKDGAPISLDGAGVIDAARATLSTAFFDLAIKVNKGLGKHFKPPPALRRFLKKIF